MENQKTVVTEKNRNFTVAEKLGVGALVLASSAGAFAEVETTGVVSAISGLGTGVAAIGGAILLILVAIKGYSLIKRAL